MLQFIQRAFGGRGVLGAQDGMGDMTLGTAERKLHALPSWALPPQSPEEGSRELGVGNREEDANSLLPTPYSRRRPQRGPAHPHGAKWLIACGAKTAEPLAAHPIQMHTHRLLLWLNEHRETLRLDTPPISRGKTRRGIFSFELEETYDDMCFELWWKPHRWSGTHGVAEHFRKLTKRKQKDYAYTILDGSECRRAFFVVSAPTPVSGHPIPKPAPKRKRKPRTTAVVVKLAEHRRVA